MTSIELGGNVAIKHFSPYYRQWGETDTQTYLDPKYRRRLSSRLHPQAYFSTHIPNRNAVLRRPFVLGGGS